MKPIWLIARTVLIEAVRRKEIYAIVLLASLAIGGVMCIDFFNVEGLTKFYREVALKGMSLAVALTVIALAARQLPREFETRTIYPLLAKPISRMAFLAGKLLGVMLAAAFCFALFTGVFWLGSMRLGASIPWKMFGQYVYLQMAMMLVLATVGFWFSMIMHLDAAVTLGVVFYAASALMTSAVSVLYDFVGVVGKWILVALTFAIPQLTLLDFSAKTVQADVGLWAPLPLKIMAELTAYGLVYAAIFFGFAAWCFRRRPL